LEETIVRCSLAGGSQGIWVGHGPSIVRCAVHVTVVFVATLRRSAHRSRRSTPMALADLSSRSVCEPYGRCARHLDRGLLGRHTITTAE
jgi:hypothetical protein